MKGALTMRGVPYVGETRPPDRRGKVLQMFGHAVHLSLRRGTGTSATGGHAAAAGGDSAAAGWTAKE